MLALAHGADLVIALAMLIPGSIAWACLAVGGRADEVLLRQEQTEAERDSAPQ